MDFTIFQHVPYESPGYILDWIHENGYSMEEVNFYDQPRLPDVKDTENLIVMGGPMNVFDDDEYSWLPAERDFIRQTIRKGTKVLGICLGSQFIADALGAKVFKNEYTEVGWFEVEIREENLPDKFKGIFPERFKTLHWHGDTFNLPDGIKGFISSKATENQAFISENVAAFQFHMEIKSEGVMALVEHNETLFKEDLPFTQKPGQMLHMNKYHESNRKILFQFLNIFFKG
ncbi:MAG: type 1 glutamine amidotransferase [Bacteroidales bacterium]|nr:type 1 glutamine amidotransferase [Bacteroidales bacterium]